MIQTLVNKRTQGALFLFVILLMTMVAGLSFFSSASGDEHKEVYKVDLLKREIPKPQPFCGIVIS